MLGYNGGNPNPDTKERVSGALEATPVWAPYKGVTSASLEGGIMQGLHIVLAREGE